MYGFVWSLGFLFIKDLEGTPHYALGHFIALEISVPTWLVKRPDSDGLVEVERVFQVTQRIRNSFCYLNME